MATKDTNPKLLIWIDLEMSGLDPECERILEIAVILTDRDLQIVEQLPSIVVHQDVTLLERMDEWNSTQHRKTGLYEEVLTSTVHEAEAEQTVLQALQKNLSAGESPMCGSSVHQDRRFLRRYMPELHEFFHYRNIDVSTVRSLAKYWRPTLPPQYKPGPTQHRAASDIRDSINELAFYRDRFFIIEED
jgi:oligoribonuclease